VLDLLITGTGRCGTKFMAEWLTRSGVPCGHEAVFSYRGYTPQPGIVADSSWLAVPYLPLVTCRIVHIVRNPLDVVRSFIGTRHFGPFQPKHKECRWYQYMALHFGYTDEDPVQQAMRYWIRWNLDIERFTDVGPFMIENDALRAVATAWLDFPRPQSIADPPPVTTNAHRKRLPLGRLPRTGYFDELATMAERYGYDPDTL
jgi:hypothetical protein